MTGSLDRVLALHTRALQLRGQRSELLASNIANADTPNYAARDLDFQSLLATRQGRSVVAIEATRSGHMQASAAQPLRLMFRQPTQPSADGNTVDLQLEKSAFTENAIAYQAQLTFLRGTFGRLLAAIRGE